MINLKRVEQTLLFLAILFLPTQLGRHFWPNFSFVYSLPIDYLSPTIYFWDLLVVLLILIWVMQKNYPNRMAVNLLLFFIFTQVLSLITTNNLGAGLVRLEQYAVAGFFGIYLSSINLKKVKSIIFWSLGIAIISQSLLAIAQFLKGATLGFWILGERSFSISTPGIAKFDFYGNQFLRPYATFPHPNVLAGFMVVVILLLSFLRKQESIQITNGSRIKYGMTRVAIFLSSITIMLTVSRTAIFTGLTSAFILLKNKNRFLLFLVVIILLPILFTRFVSLVNFDNLTLIRREELFGEGFKMWLSSPVFGIGLNNFIPAAASGLVAGPNRFLQPVHNIFLLALSESGLIGLIGLISLIGYPIFKKKFLLVWGLIIFLGFFDHYFLTLPQGYRLLFFVWGLSLSTL